MNRRGFLINAGLAGLGAAGVAVSRYSPGQSMTKPSLATADIFTGGPYIAFTDIKSGPSTGNTDTSLGQAPGQDGAIVSIWGTGFGSSQGASTVTIGGTVARVYYWGPASPPYSPANLVNGYHNMQMVICQVSHLAANGPGSIRVNVGGKASNAYPFTVRAGRIFFVKTSGSDMGAGTWTSPFQTMYRAKNVATTPGDITYVGNGVNQITDPQRVGCALRLSASGTSSAPIALVAYPGAQCQIGSTSLEAFQIYNGDANPLPTWLTVAKFTILGTLQPLNMNTGFSLVGCKGSTPTTTELNTGAFNGHGDDLAILGNEFTQCGTGSAKWGNLYHTLYISGARRAPGTESRREIAWNYFHDNLANRAINIYNQFENNAEFLTEHNVHHNVIINQIGDGIMFGYMTAGENWCYDNIIINAGLQVGSLDSAVTWNGIKLSNPGYSAARRSETVFHLWNNTLYNCGRPGDRSTNTGAWGLLNPERYILDLHNNLTYQQNGQPYISGASFNNGARKPSADPAMSSHNLWYGAGGKPSWDSNAVNSDPRIVSSGKDFHLQSSSPAINAGKVLSLVKVDFEGNPRGATYDIGAYEYTALP